jgi:hypothetical protein
MSIISAIGLAGPAGESLPLRCLPFYFRSSMLAQPGRAFPRIASGPTFRLAGRHTFTITTSARLTLSTGVDREETPEGGGASDTEQSIPQLRCKCIFRPP